MKHVISTKNFHGVIPGDIVYLDGDKAYNVNEMRVLMDDAFVKLVPEEAGYHVRESVSDTIQSAWTTNVKGVTPGLPCLVVEQIEQCPQFFRVGLTNENGSKMIHLIDHFNNDKVFYSSASTSKTLAFTLAIWEKSAFGIYETSTGMLHFCILAVPASVQLMYSQWPAGEVQNEK